MNNIFWRIHSTFPPIHTPFKTHRKLLSNKPLKAIILCRVESMKETNKQKEEKTKKKMGKYFCLYNKIQKKVIAPKQVRHYIFSHITFCVYFVMMLINSLIYVVVVKWYNNDTRVYFKLAGFYFCIILHIILDKRHTCYLNPCVCVVMCLYENVEKTSLLTKPRELELYLYVCSNVYVTSKNSFSLKNLQTKSFVGENKWL